jgi:hypothetical protein
MWWKRADNRRVVATLKVVPDLLLGEPDRPQPALVEQAKLVVAV